ncbi:MAG: alpha/beta hydrolase [Pseudomonadota bacterium]
MAIYENGDVTIHYEDAGAGDAVLLIAPGGMRSAASFWTRTSYKPIEQLAASHRVIAMDQRNAGASRGPIAADHGWHTYLADQLGLMDHLGIERFHVLGMCIGGPYIMNLIKAAPERVRSAVIFQPIGVHENEAAFFEMFDSWADELKPGMPNPESDWNAFRANMFADKTFLYVVDDDFVRGCATPILLFEGDDLYHPKPTSERLRDLAPNLTYVADWKEGPAATAAEESVKAFLAAH